VHGHFGVPTCPRRIVYRAAELKVAQLKWTSMTDKSPGMGPWSRDSMPKFDTGERVLAAEAKKAGFASKDTRIIRRPPRHYYYYYYYYYY